MKKIVAFALVLMLLFTNMCFVHAEAPAVRSSNYFHSYGVTIGDSGGGVLRITFHCVGMGICTQLGVASYEVERLDDDGSWDNASGLLEGQTGSNVASYTFGRNFNGVAGETYRVNVTFICALNGGVETKIHTSGTVTLK